MFPNKKIHPLSHKGPHVVMTPEAVEHGILFIDEEHNNVFGLELRVVGSTVGPNKIYDLRATDWDNEEKKDPYFQGSGDPT